MYVKSALQIVNFYVNMSLLIQTIEEGVCVKYSGR